MMFSLKDYGSVIVVVKSIANIVCQCLRYAVFFRIPAANVICLIVMVVDVQIFQPVVFVTTFNVAAQKFVVYVAILIVVAVALEYQMPHLVWADRSAMLLPVSATVAAVAIVIAKAIWMPSVKRLAFA